MRKLYLLVWVVCVILVGCAVSTDIRQMEEEDVRWLPPSMLNGISIRAPIGWEESYMSSIGRFMFKHPKGRAIMQIMPNVGSIRDHRDNFSHMLDLAYARSKVGDTLRIDSDDFFILVRPVRMDFPMYQEAESGEEFSYFVEVTDDFWNFVIICFWGKSEWKNETLPYLVDTLGALSNIDGSEDLPAIPQFIDEGNEELAQEVIGEGVVSVPSTNMAGSIIVEFTVYQEMYR